jgi:large subunit ribosomal protein L25
MSEFNVITAEFRTDVGKGASRRLRHTGKIPAVLYGGSRDAVALTLDHETVAHAAETEAFYSSILEIRVGDDLTQQVILRDVQRHPFKMQIMHMDFQRISATEKVRMSVPLHFIGEADSPAGRESGVVIQHQQTEIEISALPKDLPEFLSVDLSEMDAGDVVLVSDIKLPEGVDIPSLAISDENDTPVANTIHISEDQGTGAAAAAEAEALALEEGIEEVEGEELEEGEEGAAEEADAEDADKSEGE